MPEMSPERRGHRPGVLAADRFAHMRGHDYGPPIPPDPWPMVTVGHARSRLGELDVYIAPAVVNAWRQLSALAYLGDAYPPPVVDQEPEPGRCCFEPETCEACPIARACRGEL